MSISSPRTITSSPAPTVAATFVPVKANAPVVPVVLPPPPLNPVVLPPPPLNSVVLPPLPLNPVALPPPGLNPVVLVVVAGMVLLVVVVAARIVVVVVAARIVLLVVVEAGMLLVGMLLVGMLLVGMLLVGMLLVGMLLVGMLLVGMVVDDVVVDEVVVDGGGEAAQFGFEMVLWSRVTAPLRASRRPRTVALVWALIEVRARIVPTKVEFVPRVAELPTCQKTLHAAAPFSRATTLLVAVISVLWVWNTQTAFLSP